MNPSARLGILKENDTLSFRGSVALGAEVDDSRLRHRAPPSPTSGTSSAPAHPASRPPTPSSGARPLHTRPQPRHPALDTRPLKRHCPPCLAADLGVVLTAPTGLTGPTLVWSSQHPLASQRRPWRGPPPGSAGDAGARSSPRAVRRRFMGSDIPYVPNKRTGGVCIGSKIAPIFFNTMEDSGPPPRAAPHPRASGPPWSRGRPCVWTALALGCP